MPVNKQIIEVTTKGAKKSEKQLKGVTGGLKSMAKQAGIAAAAYFGSQALLGAIKSSISLFAEQELAEKKLKFAFEGATGALIEQAEAIQRNSKFGDEAVIAQQAYLASLGLTEQQIKDTISASVDLAAATGMTLESAVMNTSKTLSGMAGELGEKLGPAFRDLSIDALKAGEGIKFISEQFGGTAQAEVDTMSGALAQASNAIGDMGEALGEVLAPLIIRSANAVKFLAESFSRLFSWQNRYKNLAKETLGLVTQQEDAMMRNKESAENVSGSLQILNEIQHQWTETNKIYRDGVEQTNGVQNTMFASTDQLTHAQIAAAISTGELQETILDLVEVGNPYAEILQDLLDKYNALPESMKFAIDMQNLFNDEQLKQINLNKLQQKQMDTFIKTYPKLAKEMGLLTSTQMKDLKIQAQRKDANDQFLTDLHTTASGIEGLDKVAKKIAIAQALRDTYSSAQTQFKKFSEAYKAPAGQYLGTAAALAAIAAGLTRVKEIKNAQYGADFVTSGPQMMMVGEGTGPERVQVTPLEDPNLEGPQGQGITLNISGNVLHESFIEDEVIPQIREGLRLGENMGI